jgi:ATP-dependent helicase/nuclease subunit A
MVKQRKPLRDVPARERIRTDLGVNMLVEAGAGSGKTESLAERMVSLIANEDVRVENIAAVTFTKKAAAELRGRFRGKLERRLKFESNPGRVDRMQRAMSGMERMFAGTIHSFCANLLRERPVEAGLAPGFRELEEAEDAVRRRASWREFIDRAQKDDSPELRELLAAELKLSDLYDTFAKVCQYPDLAFPPGDGQPPDVTAGWEALDRFWKRIRPMCPVLDPASTCGLQKAIHEFEARYRHAPRSRGGVLASMMASWESEKRLVQKSWPKKNGKEAAAIAEDFRNDVAQPFGRQWRQYLYRLSMTLLTKAREFAAESRRRAALLNFTDLLLFAARLVRDNPAVRAALQEKYRFLFVDEFQDTDPLQLELLFLLTAEPGAGSDWASAPLRPGALFLVGDPKQSIYRFRRADIDMYQQAKRRVEETGGAVVSLTSCFRSGEELCEWVNGVFVEDPPAVATPYQPAFERLDAANTDPAPSPAAVRLELSPDLNSREVPFEDAKAIAAYIRSEVDANRRKFGDFLILTRRKKLRMGAYTDGLEAARIPYEVSGSGTLVESEYVQALLTLLHCLTHPSDGIALTGALRGHCFGFSDPQLYEYARSGGAFRLSVPVSAEAPGEIAAAMRRLQSWRGLLRRLPAGAAIESILEESGLLARAAAASAGGGEAGKLLFAQDCLREACNAGMTLADAIAELEEGVEDDESDAPVLEPGRRDVVRLMNLHKAKGLEGNVVFLADPAAGVRPRADIRIVRTPGGADGYLTVVRKRENRPDEILAQPAGWTAHEEEELRFVDAEERRLLYVAATRARQLLVVSNWSGKGQSTRPWKKLADALSDRPSLIVPELPPDEEPPLPDLSASCRDATAVERARRRREIAEPAFQAVTVSGMASHAGSDEAQAEEAGVRGRIWGSVIHGLLEYAVLHPEAGAGDLTAAARWLTREYPLAKDEIPHAVETIEAVRASALWELVRKAEVRLAETPLSATLPGQPVQLARGIVDLALRLDGGWHIIDYKTDLASPAALVEVYGAQVRGYASLWTQTTGEPVAYAGLYSVRDRLLTKDVRDVAQSA